jgi:hypothetical protein
MDVLKVLDREGYVDFPQNHGDIILKFKQEDDSRHHPSIRVRNKSKPSLLSPSRQSESIPKSTLLAHCPLITPTLFQFLLSPSVPLSSLPPHILSDLSLRHLIPYKQLPSSSLLPPIKSLCLSTPIKHLNPYFSIPTSPSVLCSDLLKYLATKKVNSSRLPKGYGVEGEVGLDELPLSLLVEVAKQGVVDVDPQAKQAMQVLLREILKPTPRKVGENVIRIVESFKSE